MGIQHRRAAPDLRPSAIAMIDADYCEEIVSRHARTFARASRLLPREKRRGVYAIYAFCRTADDIVDAGGESLTDATLSRLRAYRVAFRRALEEPSTEPVLRELAWAVARFAIPASALEAVVDGVEDDLSVSRYATWRELERYCHQVASSVGEMCTAIFGAPPGGPSPERALVYARKLGLAMQLTNILRDVGEDAARGRCYLPDEDLDRFSLRAPDVLSRRASPQSADWRRFMAFEIARARDLYREALPGIDLLAADAQRCALACTAGYAAILTAIEDNGFDTFNRRAVVGAYERARILARSWLKRAPEFPAPREPDDAAQSAATAA